MIGYSQPYILLYLFYLFLGFFEIKNPKNKYKIQYIECIVCILFWGLRGYIGSDWLSYTSYYDNLSHTFFNNELNYEPGFVAITGIIKLLGCTYFEWQLFIVVIQFIIFHNFFKKKVQYMFIAYIVLFSSFPLLIIDTIRNFISLLIGLWALEYWKLNRKLLSIFFIILSILFHTSGIVFFILLPLSKSYINKKIIILLFSIGIIIYLFRISYIRHIINMLGQVLGGKYSALATLYLNWDVASASYGITLGIIEKIFFFIIVIYKYDHIKKNKIFDCYILNTFILYILSNLYFTEMTILINRVAVLFFWGYIVVISNLPILFNIKANKYLIFCIIISLVFFKIISSYNDIIYNYKNVIFSKENIMERSDNLKLHYDN